MRTNEEVLRIYNQGQRQFAENKVQDLLIKVVELPKDIEWHLIGALQTNKVKHVAPFIHLIHSLDDTKLWKEINKHALKLGRTIPCLLQIKIAQEETKGGFNWNDLLGILETKIWQQYPAVSIEGVMGMATLTNHHEIVRNEFQTLKYYFNELHSKHFPSNDFSIISMGMSGDFKLAIEEGATMVRIGSLIFQN